MTGLNDVPINLTFSPDLAWRQAGGAYGESLEGLPGRPRYLLPANPNQGFWLLPKALLLELWPAAQIGEARLIQGSPYNPGPMPAGSLSPLAKEYWAGGWMLRCSKGCAKHSPLPPIRLGYRVIPCNHLSELRVMHMSGAKYRHIRDEKGEPIVLQHTRWVNDFEGVLTHLCNPPGRREKGQAQGRVNRHAAGQANSRGEGPGLHVKSWPLSWASRQKLEMAAAAAATLQPSGRCNATLVEQHSVADCMLEVSFGCASPGTIWPATAADGFDVGRAARSSSVVTQLAYPRTSATVQQMLISCSTRGEVRCQAVWYSTAE